MKKLILSGLLALICAGAFAQGRATTVEEYNYLVSGQYNLILPGHTLRKSNVDITLDFSDANRKVTIYELYRGYSQQPCAIVIIYRRLDTGTGVNICVPDIGSDSSLWQGYRSKLREINDIGNALEAVSYALGLYTSSH